MSQHQIALFTFTLGSAESISPAALRDLRAGAMARRKAIRRRGRVV